jgi:hypothetical protein
MMKFLRLRKRGTLVLSEDFRIWFVETLSRCFQAGRASSDMFFRIRLAPTLSLQSSGGSQLLEGSHDLRCQQTPVGALRRTANNNRVTSARNQKFEFARTHLYHLNEAVVHGLLPRKLRSRFRLYALQVIRSTLGRNIMRILHREVRSIHFSWR